MKRLLIIVNPNSGDKSSETIEDQLNEQFKEKNVETRIYQTTGEDNFKELIQNEMDNELDLVVTLGGDGTISEVINGIAPLEHRPKVSITFRDD